MPVYLWQNQRSFQVTVGSDNANNKLVCLAKLEKDKGLDAVGRQVDSWLNPTFLSVAFALQRHCGLAWLLILTVVV